MITYYLVEYWLRVLESQRFMPAPTSKQTVRSQWTSVSTDSQSPQCHLFQAARIWVPHLWRVGAQEERLPQTESRDATWQVNSAVSGCLGVSSLQSDCGDEVSSTVFVMMATGRGRGGGGGGGKGKFKRRGGGRPVLICGSRNLLCPFLKFGLKDRFYI